MNSYIDIVLEHYCFLDFCFTTKTGAPVRPAPIAKILINLFTYHPEFIRAIELGISTIPRYYTTELPFGQRTYHEADTLLR